MPSNFCKKLNYGALNQMVQALDQAPANPAGISLVPALLTEADCERLVKLDVNHHSIELDRLLWEFNSGNVLQRLAKLSNAEALIPDPKLRQAGLMTSPQALEYLQAIGPEHRHQDTGLYWAASVLLCASPISLAQYQLRQGDALLVSTIPAQLAVTEPGNHCNMILIHYYSLPS